MNRWSSVVVVGIGVALAACGGAEPEPRTPDDEAKQSDLNRAHENVKRTLGEAAGDARVVAEKVQDRLHGAAEAVSDELGVRKSVTTGTPSGGSSASPAPPAPSVSPASSAPPAPSGPAETSAPPAGSPQPASTAPVP